MEAIEIVKEEKRVAIIDSDSILFYTCYSKKDEPQKSLEDCYNAVDSFMYNLFNLTESTHYILYLTTGKESFRYKIYPEYKGNRKYKETIQYFKEVKQYLIDKYHAQVDLRYEADDLCLITKNRYKSDPEYSEVFISSPDQDMLSLEGRHYNYKKNQWIETSKKEASLKFWEDMICGQTGDNIKGIPGKGKKFTEKLFDSTSFYADLVLNEYILHYGEHKGIKEFYKNYMCLKIVEEDHGVSTVHPYSVKELELKEVDGIRNDIKDGDTMVDKLLQDSKE